MYLTVAKKLFSAGILIKTLNVDKKKSNMYYFMRWFMNVFNTVT